MLFLSLSSFRLHGFEDGKDGCRDLRLFAEVYLIIRFIGTLVLLMSRSYTRLLFRLLVIIPTIALSGTCFILRPYKDGFYNYLDGLFFLYGTLLLSLYMFPIIFLLLIFYLSTYHMPPITLKIFPAIPIFYLSGLILCKIARKVNWCVAKFWPSLCLTCTTISILFRFRGVAQLLRQ